MEFAAPLTRLVQFAAAMILCGGGLFFAYGMTVGRARWPRRLLVGAAASGALATLGWIMVQAGNLGDTPAAAFDPATVLSVAIDTGFGRAAAIRAGLFGLAMVTLVASRSFIGPGLFGVLVAASFAWTGHGAADEGAAGWLHLVADVVHLVAAAIWLGALVPLAVLAMGSSAPAARRGMEAFSGIGPAVVAVLVLSGLANSWFLVGPSRALDLPHSPWGVLMLVKLGTFTAMLGLAAANRYAVTPRLARGGLGAMRISLIVETTLGLVVLGCVAWLGTLAPPSAG